MNADDTPPPTRPSPTMQAILERLAREDGGQPDPTTCPPAEGRRQAARANLRWNTDLPSLGHVDDILFTGTGGHDIPARLYLPENAVPGLVVYVHGGGFAFCDIASHERAVRCLAIECATATLSVDYRLAPEHPYPCALEDCLEVVRSLDKVRSRHPATRGPLALAGDSAGANLALATLLALGRDGDDTVVGVEHAMLFYGVYGTDFDTPSYHLYEHGPGLTRAKMQRCLDWYAPPDVDRREPLLAPVLASDQALRRLPPLYLNAAEIDPLRSDTERLVERLRGLGRDDHLCVVEGVVHGFMQMSRELPAARRAIADAAAAFRLATGR